MSTRENQIQQRFFKQLEQELPQDINLADWLGELLDLDPSNVYRRIRGEKKLLWEEYLKISKKVPQLHYGFQELNQTDFISGKLRHFNDWESLAQYFNNILILLQNAAEQGYQLYYVARDLPFFCFYSTPRLMAYKISVWTKCGGIPVKGPVPQAILQLGNAIFKTYLNLNTREIWYNWGIYNQMEQLRHWHHMDYINLLEFEELKNDLVGLFENYKKWLSVSQKQRGKLEIYASDFCVMNNSGLLEMGHNSLLMNGFQGIHFISTQNPNAIQLFKSHWKEHIKLAQPIFGSGEKDRYTFFKRFKKQLEIQLA